MIKLPIDLKSNEPQVKMLIILVSGVILVLYLQLLFIPQITWLTNIFSEIGKVRAELKQGESDIANMGKFKGEIGSYKEKINWYEEMLPVEREIPNLLENLSGMAKSSGIKIIGITPVVSSSKEMMVGQKPEIYQEIPILVNAKSGFHELGSFLSNLENADRFMKVVDIEIKSSKTTPKKHDVELVLCTYILLPEKLNK